MSKRKVNIISVYICIFKYIDYLKTHFGHDIDHFVALAKMFIGRASFPENNLEFNVANAGLEIATDMVPNSCYQHFLLGD